MTTDAPIDLGDIVDAFGITGRGFIIIASKPVLPPHRWPGQRVRFKAHNGEFVGTVKEMEGPPRTTCYPISPSHVRIETNVTLLIDIDGIDPEKVSWESVRR